MYTSIQKTSPQTNTVLTMEKQSTYRVKEINGKFYIQIKVVEVSGFGWWRKTNERWEDANITGQANTDLNYFEPMKGFKTLKEAQNKIKEFNPKPTYHV